MLTPSVERRLKADLDFHVVRADAIEPWQVHNNQLQHVWSADGREVVVKTYFQDDRHRLDLEYSGWDDPLMPASDFLTAETSTSLRAGCAETFLRTYAEAVRLTPLELARLSRMRALMEIGWIAVHLCLLAPERIAPKQFADPSSFDVAAHVAEHAALAEARLIRAKALVPTLL